MNKLLCAGMGRLNQRVARRWLDQGGDVIGLRRSNSDPSLGFLQQRCDLSAQVWPDVQADAIVVALASGERSEAGYRRTYVDAIQRLSESLAHWSSLPERVLVVSSSRVYGVDDGAWVDDETHAETDDAYGQILLEMEALVQALPMRTSVLRLSGIYGPNRDWLKRQAIEADELTQNRWTNRIHLDDAAAAIDFLLRQPTLAPSYIVSDTQPVSQQGMYNYFRERLGLPLITQAPDASGGKRLIPSRLQAAGFCWQYPTAFSGGYDALF